MDTKDREILKAENQRLLALRQKHLPSARPKPAPLPERPPLEFIVADDLPEAEYIRAIKTGQPTGNQTEVITGDNTRWRMFDSERHPDLERAVRTIKRWYNGPMRTGGGLVLLGHCGSGKTHLARALAELYGPYAAFVDEEELVGSVQSTYGTYGGRTEHEIIQRLRQAELLVFDDIGAYGTDNTPWIQNLYFKLFDGRQEVGRPLIVTSNLSYEVVYDRIKNDAGEWVEINHRIPLEERLGARCFSRIMGQATPEYVIDLFDVPDYRLRGF